MNAMNMLFGFFSYLVQKVRIQTANEAKLVVIASAYLFNFSIAGILSWLR